MGAQSTLFQPVRRNYRAVRVYAEKIESLLAAAVVGESVADEVALRTATARLSETAFRIAARYRDRSRSIRRGVGHRPTANRLASSANAFPHFNETRAGIHADSAAPGAEAAGAVSLHCGESS